METLSIGEVAQQVGLPASTLRYYEQIGLLPPPPRRRGQRRFSSAVLPRLQMIVTAREIGFSLEEIKVLLDGMSPDSPPAARWQAIAATKLPEIEAHIRRAEQMKQILQQGLNCECIDIERCFSTLNR